MTATVKSNMHRTILLGAALLFAGSVTAPAIAQTTSYPARLIRLIVPVPAGGPSDLMARALAEAMRVELGQPLVVDNRPGAAGALGTASALQSSPDGYTLVLSAPSSQVTAPLLMEKPLFDGVRGLTAIGQFARYPVVLLASQATPVRSVPELVAYAKQRPGKLNYASAGIGSSPHLVGELLKAKTGIHLVHIPYRGGAPALQALVNDEAQVYFDSLSSALPWIRAGKVRPLAVLSARRNALLPDVPTLMEEKVLDAPSDFWLGLAGPAGLPDAVVARLSQALAKATTSPELSAFLAKGAGEPAFSTPEAFQSLWVTEQRRWSEVIRTNRIRAE